MTRVSPELTKQRIAELRKQLRQDAKFLRYISGEEITDAGFAATNAITEPLRTPAHDTFAGNSLAVRKFMLAQNAYQLPELSAGIANRPVRQRIGIICDEFLYKSFAGLADFVPVTPTNYKHIDEIDVLLLVSTWRGIDGESWFGVTHRGRYKQRLLLEQLVPHFRAKDVPVVFYSKEDPPNFHHFLPFAKVAEVIFTSAEEMIPRYEEECPDAESIGVLPFGVNPLHHSPVGHRAGTQSIVPFAGSWFNHKYHSRGRWGHAIFQGVATSTEHDLLIFDRNSNLNQEKYNFPIEFAGAVSNAIGHDELLELMRLSDIAINLNSVQDSMTMFANRAVELQAMGTLVISNYNAGINSLYPQIHTANSPRDVRGMLETLNLDVLRKNQADGIRDVFTHDLTHLRIDTILQSVGLSTPERKLKVVAVADKADDQLRKEFEAQSYGATEVVSEAEFADRKDTFDVKFDASTKLRYGTHYVQDLINALSYTSATTVGKVVGDTANVDKVCHTYSDEVLPTGLSAEYLSEHHVPAHRHHYVVDNFAVQRRDTSITVLQEAPAEPAFSVVVPIYNNGRHLEHKCFASLRRSSMFANMEIIFVDDGSTDVTTLEVIDRLAEQYKNIVVYKYPTGGSGSASRPRNKGLELATADYITYLDPDNEALNDGFTSLWRRLQNSGANFAIGNMSRWRSGHSVSNYVNMIKSRLDARSNILELDKNSLTELGFQPMSIQALMADTQWLRSLGISQPEGAVGQDSYFFQQMFYYANTIALVPRVIHTYYGEVANSVVNTVSAKFFEKYRPLEVARAAWLQDVGLLEEYKQARLEAFFAGWYLAKLELVSEEERPQAISTILDLVDFYGDYKWTDPSIIDFLTEQGRLTAAEAAELKEGALQD